MIYIVGAGIFGSVMAERITSELGMKVIIIDKRNHIGGNCYSFIDPETGINCHKYGSHIFHTSDDKVMKYVSKFMKLNQYRHFVLSRYGDCIYHMPINLDTINKFFNKHFSPNECKTFLLDIINKSKIDCPKNFEEQAISLIGKDLYEAFIKGYTKKQWQRDPKELPSYIIKRLPFRTSYCFDYFNDTYQGIPIGGYTPFFKKLLSNNLIELKLNTDFLRIKKIIKPNDFVIYTGPVDEFFDFSLGKLEWRTLDFKWKTLNVEDYQGCAVLNEANANIPYTRTHEFKHYHPEILDIVSKNKTVICEEYSREYQDGDIQYYPIDTQKNRMLYEKYKQLALEYPNLILGGRLGMYKYFDMDKAILAALDTFNLIKPKLQNL